MRIAICGSHGVGKTTLLNAINSDNKITEVARKIIEEFGNPRYMTEFEKVFFQIQVLREQLTQETFYQNYFISDRSVIDILAYWNAINPEKMTKSELQKINSISYEIQKLMRENLKKSYDLIFYIPIEFPLDDDGVRFKGDEFQKKIDENIQRILKSYDIPYITLTGSVEERLKKFYEVVNLFTNNQF